jgi:hypothetical protein
MSSRQRLALKTAAYLALLTAAVHMVGEALGMQSDNPIEQQLITQASTVPLALPGATRTLMNLIDGFGLVFVTFLGTTAGIAFLVARRAASDTALAQALVRTLASAYVVLTVVSVMKFFLIPTACLALIAVSLLLAAF